MSFTIITIGKIRNKNLVDEISDLQKRITRFNIITLKEVKEKNIDVLRRKEFDLIKPYLKPNVKKVLLWEFGREFNTNDFYEFCNKQEQDILFIITGAFGPCDELKKEVDFTLSLSKMTFTHEQALYMLVEQLYRVDCFEKNIPYTK